MFALLQALTLVTGAFSADASRRNHGFCFSFLFYLFPLIFGYRNGWQNICLSNSFHCLSIFCRFGGLWRKEFDSLVSWLLLVPWIETRFCPQARLPCSPLSWRLTMRLFALSPAVYQFSLKPWYTSSVGAAVCIHSHLEKSRHSPMSCRRCPHVSTHLFGIARALSWRCWKIVEGALGNLFVHLRRCLDLWPIYLWLCLMVCFPGFNVWVSTLVP